MAVTARGRDPRDLGLTLTALLRAYARDAEPVMTDLPGGERGYRLLHAVRDCPPTQSVLAERTGLDRTVVTYLVDDLAGAGLVQRRADPSDRRSRRVVLTEAGAARLADLAARLGEVERHVVHALDDDEAALLRDLLDRASTAAEIVGDPTACGHVVGVVAGAPGISAG